MISSRANAYRFRALRTIESLLSRQSGKGNRLQHCLPQQQLNSLIASNHHNGNFISRSFSHPSRETISESNNEVFSATSDEQSILNLASVIANLDRASKFNQGKGGGPNSPKSMWNLEFVRNTVEQYEQLLRYFYLQNQGESISKNDVPQMEEPSEEMMKLFLSPRTTELAFRAMLRCKVPTSLLSQKVREWERYIGALGKTSLTDDLSLRMLEANGKAGNVGRAIKLLKIRKSRDYTPKRTEFVYAIQAIQSAGLYLRGNRNIFLSDNEQPQIDDPTRWLDAILLNMNQRDFPLTVELANRMLNTYASTGKTGKATHFFYRVVRTPVDEDDHAVKDEDAVHQMAHFRNQPVKVKMQMRPPPPYHKIPSQVRGKLVRKPGTEIKQLKLDRELDPDWSPPLSAAISFADSLTQGACGHDPIDLNLISYSTLIKACVNRGSLWRAMHILDEVMPSNGIDPDVITYNTLLKGLSRVGDAPTMKSYFNQMILKGIPPSKETVEAIVDGLLNLGDVGSAITLVQDCFNQHSILPPYTTHLKILEFALGRSLVYEAKRHVYFIQQIWKWERNDYHSEEFSKLMTLVQKNPKLSKEALIKLFAYFGETLDESDFI